MSIWNVTYNTEDSQLTKTITSYEAEIARLKAELAEAQKNAAITEYYADGPRGVRRVADLEATNLRHRLFSGFDGCTDGGCVISDNRKGMHTNGGCNCFLNMSRSQLNIVQSRLQAILYSAARSE